MSSLEVSSLVTKTIAGKYEVKSILGEGGTGVVYDAVRLEDGVNVALKVMHPHLAGDKQIRGRFKREAAILKRLEGPHVCPILELGETPGAEGEASLLYMALPKLEGPSLGTVLEKESPIAVDRALDVLLEVCDGLRTAHAQGVIHRDLKPANVILDREKGVVVVDFGMSKIITGAGIGTGATGTTNLTAHNMVFGTPEYMSPEQARGDELDARCDVYAAGVMLYEMLTGEHPFTAASPLGVLTEHLTGELVPPSKRAEAGRVTPALESVVLYALARDRNERYPSASALSAAIRHARAVPNDVDSLRPEAFATSPAGTDAFAVTMPAIVSPIDSSRPAVVRESGAIPTNATVPASPSQHPSPLSNPPSTIPRSRAASSTNPTLPPISADTPPDKMSPMWIVVWVVAAAASIGIGVWFALHH